MAGKVEHSRCLIPDEHRPGQWRFSIGSGDDETVSPQLSAPSGNACQPLPLDLVLPTLEHQQSSQPAREEPNALLP
jgi:hypothetical protein